jgi:uncharacterized protein (TIGR00255 family)
MPIRSMTGYGRSSFTIGPDASPATLALEISSVNRRGLEIFVSAPPEWLATLERLTPGWVREFAVRGKITLLFQTQGLAPAETLFWDSDALAQSLAKLARQAAALNVPFAPNTGDLLRLVELHRSRRDTLPPLDDEPTQAALAAQVRATLAQFVSMREREGAFLATDLLARLAALEGLLAQISVTSGDSVPRYRDLLLSRLRQAGLEFSLQDERVLKEIALFADRCDIAEEVTRLHSHFAQFRACLADGREVGRKLDFLCQEMNRELNTIGSKANQIQITRHIIDAKNELERIREQVQNVE